MFVSLQDKIETQSLKTILAIMNRIGIVWHPIINRFINRNYQSLFCKATVYYTVAYYTVYSMYILVYSLQATSGESWSKDATKSGKNCTLLPNLSLQYLSNYLENLLFDWSNWVLLFYLLSFNTVLWTLYTSWWYSWYYILSHQLDLSHMSWCFKPLKGGLELVDFNWKCYKSILMMIGGRVGGMGVISLLKKIAYHILIGIKVVILKQKNEIYIWKEKI